MSARWPNLVLSLFAREASAGQDRIIILVLDSAGWHTEPGLKMPDGIEELDAVVTERCRTLDASPDLFKGRLNFHWWRRT